MRYRLLSALLLLGLCLASAVWAAPLTEEQYAILRTDITVTHAAEFADLVAASYDAPIADSYNQDQSPNFWVWRTSLPKKEIYETITGDGTAWSWTLYINRSQAERDAWRDLFDQSDKINPALLNTRQGMQDIFSGPAGQAQRTHLLTMARRLARRGERLYVTTGAGTTAEPGMLVFEGLIRPIDIAHALRGVPLP